MPRPRPIILVTKLPKSEEKQADLKRCVAQIHANAVIRRLSELDCDSDSIRALRDSILSVRENEMPPID